MSDVTSRLWARDADLWKPGDAAHAAVIHNRLGWLDVIDNMRQAIPRLRALAQSAIDGGVRDVVLLGMGGSSLCPEVLRTAFGSASGYPTLHVLDTTDPVAINTLTQRLDTAHTWFVVSSKSGTTLETLSHYAHFADFVKATGDAGSHFITVTDPGSPLAELARTQGFREIFENPADIGGRYSALSFFGMVPAAFLGIDLEKFLDRADQMRSLCREASATDANGVLELGPAMAHHHGQGRDKVTILAPPQISAFSLWAEQLIAESTGKEGKGIIPIGDEPIGNADSYGDDRFFVSLTLGNDATRENQIAALVQAHPLLTLELRDTYDLAAEFFRWEFATAIASAALHIDPFDEPNVKESKDNTNRVLANYDAEGKLQSEPAGNNVDLQALLGQVKAGDYIAIMAYVTPDHTNYQALQELRVAIRDQLHVATTVGFGPRFLHSTGQLHKGGPNTGVFIQFTQHDAVDVPISDQPFSFSTLKHAQAIGDFKSLIAHQRRVVHLDLGNDVAGNIRGLTQSLLAFVG